MSYYQYYQQQPQWGTSAYQVVAPPRPIFQPQPNWGGSHYFRAQAGLGYEDDLYRDEGFFDGIWRGLKDIFSRGYSREEASLWYRRIYGGMVPIDQLDAAQVGAAAGYEAIRQWTTYRSVYRSPLADDREREKEALAGLAAGEAVKLLSYSPRPRSRHTRREAAEVAAATAERIFAEDYEGDPYSAYETRPYGSRRRRSLSRRRSSSYSGQRPIIATSTGGTYVSATPTGASYGYTTQQAYATQPYVQQQVYTPTAQPQYLSATGQPVQYVQTGGSYVQPQQTYVQQSAYAQPAQQVAYAATGQPVGYAATGASFGYAASPQPQYVVQQPTLGVPTGYTRARALSTGYTGAPGYVIR